MKTIVSILLLLLITFQLPGASEPVEKVEGKELVIVNIDNDKERRFYVGDQMRLILKNGEKINGKITGFAEQNILIDNQAYALSELKQIAYFKDPQKRKKTWRNVGITVGILAIIAGIIGLNSEPDFDVDNIVAFIILLVFIIALGILFYTGIFLGIILILFTLLGWHLSRKEIFDLRRRYKAFIRNKPSL